MNSFQKILLAFFIVFSIVAGINPRSRFDWFLENCLVILTVAILFIAGRYAKKYFRLSNISYALIALYLLLHVLGTHYSYAEVPFGYSLGDLFGTSRNMYDRLVHFGFGFLLAYPIREVFGRIAGVKGFWSYYLPFDVTLSFSAMYEIFEWLVAVNVAPAAGIAFLATQGDVWDTQKDMAMAALGSLIAMCTLFCINWWRDRALKTEVKSAIDLKT